MHVLLSELIAAIKNNDDHTTSSLLKQIIEEHIDINERDEGSMTALHYAVENGNDQIITLLIRHGAEDFPNPNNKKKALAYAALHQNRELVYCIFCNGLINAVKKNNIDFVEKYLEIVSKTIEFKKIAPEKMPTIIIPEFLKGRLDQTDAELRTALNWAVREGISSIIMNLIKVGAEDIPDPDTKETALMYAVKNNNVELVTSILEKQENNQYIHSKDNKNKTALNYAVQNESAQIIEFLISKGSEDVPDPDTKETALMYAVKNNNVELARSILENKANRQYVDTKNSLNRIALNYAVEKGNAEMIEILIRNGAEDISDPDTQDEAIKYAHRSQNLKLITCILGNKLINFISKNDLKSARDFLLNLKQAAQAEEGNTKYKNIIKMASEMVKNEINADGETALCWAVKKRNGEIVEELVNSGADPTIVSRDGYFSKDTAMALGERDIVQLLLKTQNDTITHDEHEHYRAQASLARELGYVYGISNDKTNPIRLTHPSSKESTIINFEGETPYIAVEVLLQLVKAYEKSNVCQNPNFLNKIVSALEQRSQYLQCSPAVTEETLIKMAQDGQLMIATLTSSETGSSDSHTVVLSYYKDNLVYCNRGFGKQSITGTTVYLKPTQAEETTGITEAATVNALSATDLKEYCYGKNGVYVTQSEIEEWVKKQTENHFTDISLPSKDQAHGTCNFVNAKSSIQGILYLLERERLMNSGVTDLTILDTEAKSYAAMEYKLLTKFMRDEIIKKLIKLAKEALDKASQQTNLQDIQSTLNDDVLFYKQLLIHTIKAHHGKEARRPAKRSEELARIQMIYRAFQDTPIMEEIITELGEPFRALFQQMAQASIEKNGTPEFLPALSKHMGPPSFFLPSSISQAEAEAEGQKQKPKA